MSYEQSMSVRELKSLSIGKIIASRTGSIEREKQGLRSKRGSMNCYKV